MSNKKERGTKMPNKKNSEVSSDKYSIIIPSYQGISHIIRCLKSLFEYTENCQIVVIENGSDDGTREYLQAVEKSYDNLHVIVNYENVCFSKANNQGIKFVQENFPDSEYIIFLNNDTEVSRNWADNMDRAFKECPVHNIGMIGPVTNNSNGQQAVGLHDPDKWHKDHQGHWSHTGILYGWCMMVKKHIIDEIGGFDERFSNSYEDNDLCLRLKLAGYNLVIAKDTYIFHHGQGALSQQYTMQQYIENGINNRELYFDKYYDRKPKKLVAVYRTNGGKHLEKSLEQTSKFADKIIIHFCRADKEIEVDAMLVEDGKETPERIKISREDYIDILKEEFPKIYKVQFYDGAFQEDYERNWLLQEALKLHEAGQADWCISVDDDEIYEDKFIERCQKLMTPRNPEVMGYWCQWRTIWETRPDGEYFRKDSVFGQFTNYRFFRLIKGQQIMSKYHPEGHHCGSAPLMAEENLRWSNIRVKHLGYDTPEQRQKKYEFYEENDHYKTKEDIGEEDYSHLISKSVMLEKYDKDNGITLLMMVKNEENFIRDALEHVSTLVDEYVIVDTGSTDRTIEIINDFKKYSTVPVKLLHYPWCDNYSLPRNYGKKFATQKWILFMDADERFQYHDLNGILDLSESEADAVKFTVLNYMKAPTPGVKGDVATTESQRLFRNIPELFFNGIIHETIDDALGILNRRRKITRINATFRLHHHGYLKPKKRVREKMDYYEKLNLKQIEITGGKDPRPYFNLGLHYISDGKDQEGLKNFVQCLKINNNIWHAHQQMASLNMNSAKIYLRNALNTMPHDHQYKEQAEKILAFLEQNSRGCVKWEDYASKRS